MYIFKSGSRHQLARTQHELIVTVQAVMVRQSRVQQPLRMAEEKKRLIRSMRFEKKVKPSLLAGSFDRDLFCVCRFLAEKETPQRSGPPTKLTEAMVSKTIHILCLQGLQAHAHGLRPMPPGHSPN